MKPFDFPKELDAWVIETEPSGSFSFLAREPDGTILRAWHFPYRLALGANGR